MENEMVIKKSTTGAAKATKETTPRKVKAVAKTADKTKSEVEEASVSSDRSEKERYYDLKRRVLSWENDNYNKLAVVDAGKGWYKMFGNSAIIYVCQLAKRLSLKAELISDTDFELATDKPVFLFRELGKFEERLKRLKIFRCSMDDGVYVFDLGYKVDACDIASMQKENEIIRARANKLVLPKEVFPGLRNELRALARSVYEVVRRMNPVAREMMGDEMVKICARCFENFVEAANGHTDMRQYLKKTVKDLRRIDAKLLLISDLRLIEDNKNYNLILQVGKVQKKVAAALMKVEKENTT